jgi:hypothetical protein
VSFTLYVYKYKEITNIQQFIGLSKSFLKYIL